MLLTEPSEAVIEWYRSRKEELAKSKGNNRTYYWNFSRELKIKFIALLCEQYEISKPEFEFNNRRVAEVDSTRTGAYLDGKIYCSAKATHAKHLLRLFYQHKLRKSHGLHKDNFPELFSHSERFATEYWKKLSKAVKDEPVVQLPLPVN
jgi:hypothetical protein